jgi:hypothetical protein
VKNKLRGATPTRLSSGLIFEMQTAQEVIIMRVLLITLLATVVLSSSASATQNSGKAWWPQFSGPKSSEFSEGKPPVNFGPDQNILWKSALGVRAVVANHLGRA